MYNPTTKRIISSRDVKWADWKPTDPRNNMDIFVKYDPTDIVLGVDEMVVEIIKSPGINKLELHVIPDDGDYDNGENQVASENIKMVKLEEN